MIVIYDCQLYELNMPWMLFQSYKEKHPDFVVELVELTESCYKKILHIEIKYVEDHSIERNLLALRN
jgi:hypothetical protein